jgi:iron complex transport system substrate-binding protein
MNKTTTIIVGVALIIIVATAAAIGYNQNWFQNTTNPSPTATPQPTETAQPTTQPTTTAQPSSSTNQPTTTTQPTAVPTTQPTTVASMDLVLEVYGNANMDDKIDSKDAGYVYSIMTGRITETQFADANRDGKIDQKDIDQVNAIIAGTASKLWLLDGNKQDITVSLPANRIIVEYIQNAEIIRVLGLESKVVGVDYCIDLLKSFYFPENAANIKSVGQMNNPDYEAVMNLDPDILLTFTSATAEKSSKLLDVDVVFLGLYYPNVTAPEDSKFIQGVLKAGYIFDKVDRATEYANWLLGLTSSINAKASTLTPDQMHSVFITNCPTMTATVKAYATIDTLGQACILAGGSNIAKILPTYLTASSVTVDTEWIVDQDPEYIFLHTVRYTFGGGTFEPEQGLDVSDTTSIKNCLQDYMSQTAFTDLTAVKNNHVYIIAGDFRNNGMGGTLGAVYMAKILYPDLMSDINTQTIHQEYITRFLRLDYNLDQEGVFLYPAITVNSDTVGIPNGAR